ncbi:hypothetical protein A9Q84_21525 [Halobacteriovorax marinus]|uniref:RecX first three-helical domain-containing protein n=1 Tax=Halobacteriovorax marinus TaxID=97084 RepID=A0A1Y5F1T7_9BACT|nr:hypothetical protein A9Q84_21525 [Halobacteriovorax marinus]
MKINEESSEKSAYLYAIRLLAKQDYSNYKITKKLKDRGYESIHISATIDKIIDLGYLREENYSIARIQAYMHKGLHPEFIQMKLKQEFVEVELSLIHEVFSEYSITSDHQLGKIIVKKSLDKESYNLLAYEAQQKMKQKVFRYAQSKGHQFDDIQRIFSKVLNNSQ